MKKSNFIRYRDALLDYLDIPMLWELREELREILKKDGENESLDYKISALNSLLQDCETNNICPHCGRDVYCSDIPDYEFVCPHCCENFYGFECSKKEGR